MKQEDIVYSYEDIKNNYYVGGYNIVKSYTSFDSIRIFSAEMNGYEIHAHPEYEIIMVIGGTLKVETEGSMYNLHEMDIVIINSNKYHILEGDEDTEIIIVQIQDDYVASLFNDEKPKFSNYYTKKNNFKLSSLVLNLFLSNYKNPENHKMIMKYLETIVKELDKLDSNTYTLKIAEMGTREIVLAVIEDFSKDNTLTLESLANKYQISYSHLSREFLNVSRLHFTDYIRHVRINFAVHRLLNTNMSQTDVAFESGFSNSQVFSRTFKEIFKQTPSQFRNNNRVDIVEELPQELIQRIEEKLIHLDVILNNSLHKIEKYNIDFDNPSVYKVNKSFGKIVDINQLSRGDFYISDLLSSLEKFTIQYLRVDFELKDGIYYPVFGTLTDPRILKISFNELLAAINRLGINLLLRIRVKKETLDYEDSLMKHSEAMGRLLNYVSLKIGLKNLRHWAYELYVEDFNADYEADFEWLHDFSLGMVEEVSKKLFIEELIWGINLGNHEDFDLFKKIVKLLDTTFTDRKPVFLSLHCTIRKELKENSHFLHMCNDNNLSNLLSQLPYKYLLDLSYKIEHEDFDVDPLRESSYCIHLIKGMLKQNIDFELVSWGVEDSHEKRMGSFYDDKGIETVSYHVSHLMSKLNDNIRYIEPGLIFSSDKDENYNILLLSHPYKDLDNITRRDVTYRTRKIVELCIENIEGRYKIIETKIPINTFYEYFNWLSVLDSDALSIQEKQDIRYKVAPELKVSIEDMEKIYNKKVNVNQLDFMLIELKKL